MRWVTRKNASVDRIACPWLIRRFVDPEAEFLYVPVAEVAAVAEREGAIPYDVAGVELGHVDGRCSFESIILKYGIEDPALDRLATVFKQLDACVGEFGANSLKAATKGIKATVDQFGLAAHEDKDAARRTLGLPSVRKSSRAVWLGIACPGLYVTPAINFLPEPFIKQTYTGAVRRTALSSRARTCASSRPSARQASRQPWTSPPKKCNE